MNKEEALLKIEELKRFVTGEKETKVIKTNKLVKNLIWDIRISNGKKEIFFDFCTGDFSFSNNSMIFPYNEFTFEKVTRNDLNPGDVIDSDDKFILVSSENKVDGDFNVVYLNSEGLSNMFFNKNNREVWRLVK